MPSIERSPRQPMLVCPIDAVALTPEMRIVPPEGPQDPQSLRIGSKKSDCFLEFLCGPEGDLLARLDLDGLACCRIAPHARRALADLQDAKPTDTDAVTLLQMPGD